MCTSILRLRHWRFLHGLLMVTLGFRTQIVHTRATSPLSSTLAAASSYQSPESGHLPNTQNLGSTVVFQIPRTATSFAATTGATYVPPRLPMLLTVMVLRPVRGGEFAARTRDWRRVTSAAMPKLDLEATYLMVRMSKPTRIHGDADVVSFPDGKFRGRGGAGTVQVAFYQVLRGKRSFSYELSW